MDAATTAKAIRVNTKLTQNSRMYKGAQERDQDVQYQKYTQSNERAHNIFFHSTQSFQFDFDFR